jgi:hypothetical protein
MEAIIKTETVRWGGVSARVRVGGKVYWWVD